MTSVTRTTRRLVLTAVLAMGLGGLASCSSDGGSDAAPDATADGSSSTSTGDATGATTTTEADDESQDDSEAVPADEWSVAEPAAHDMDGAVLEGARDYAFADGRNTQGVVVVRGGEIVAEWYAEGADADSWAGSWSMAKSFTSALIGIAIEDGLIPSVDEPMATYFPDWAGTDKAAITIQDVLWMQSGLAWDEGYSPDDAGESEIIAMVTQQTDQLAYAASIGVEAPPHSVFNYSSGDTQLLSGVLQQATGMPVDEYARQELFDPLEIEQAEWWRDAAGHTLTYCCLDTTSRGFARFGLLYLHDGAWGDEQLVPEGWVADSVEPAPNTGDIYGNQWWLDDVDGVPADAFAAVGHDGQWIWVVPSLDLVVVRNGTYVKDPGDPIADPNLFSRYPSDGLMPGKGTIGPEEWSDAAFLGPIVASIS